MATNKPLWFLVLVVCCAPVAPRAGAKEAAAAASCQSAANTPAIAGARHAVAEDPTDVRASFGLADAWSDAGCFNEAVDVLQEAKEIHPGNKELDTRLRVAKSLVGEEHYFDNLDRANADAKTKRQTFRCTSLADLDACNDAVRMKPEDASLVVAQGDALLHAKRPADAIARYRHAATMSPNQPDVVAKIAAAEALLPAGQSAAAAAPAQVAQATPRPVAPDTATVRPGKPGKAAKPVKVTPPKIQVARNDAEEQPLRRYSNAAANDRSH